MQKRLEDRFFDYDAGLQWYPSGLPYHTARCKPTEEWAVQSWRQYRMQTTGQSLQKSSSDTTKVAT